MVTVATGGVKAMKHLGNGAYTGHDRQRPGTELVPLLNFSRWLQQNVAAQDFVVVKMDIEGSEYEVLPSLLRSRAITLIDELLLEVRVRVNPDTNPNPNPNPNPTPNPNPNLVRRAAPRGWG